MRPRSNSAALKLNSKTRHFAWNVAFQSIFFSPVDDSWRESSFIVLLVWVSLLDGGRERGGEEGRGGKAQGGGGALERKKNDKIKLEKRRKIFRF